jgi:hypothetical protein
MRAKLREVAEAANFDPKAALIESLGTGINSIEMFLGQVLCATYIEPAMTPGGIIRPDRTLAENRFQGKIFLVLKMGPLAFKDDAISKFGGVVVKEGDWVVANPSDGYELFSVDDSRSAGTCCRIFEDACIKGRIADPALIY